MEISRRNHRAAVLLEQGEPSASGGGGGRNGTANGGEASFDTNMVIILAALLCALIFALGLNSIVRCALRCGRRLSLDAPGGQQLPAPGRGLKKSALRRIPVAAYGGSAKTLGTDCTICLGEFVDGEKVRVLPRCGHGFHVRCIDPWLASHSSCPTCRRSLLEAGNSGGGVGDRHHVVVGVDGL